MHTSAPEAVELAISLSNVSRSRPTARTGAVDYFDGCSVPAGDFRAKGGRGIATGNMRGGADGCHAEPRAIRVLRRLVARRAVFRDNSSVQPLPLVRRQAAPP